MSIGNLYPSMIHKEDVKTKKLWKNYYIPRKEQEIYDVV